MYVITLHNIFKRNHKRAFSFQFIVVAFSPSVANTICKFCSRKVVACVRALWIYNIFMNNDFLKMTFHCERSSPINLKSYGCNQKH